MNFTGNRAMRSRSTSWCRSRVRPDGPQAPVVIATGADFYGAPRLAADGNRLAWIEWNHPNMPWDGTRLMVADVLDSGNLGESVAVDGGDDIAIVQPSWSPCGELHYVSDRSGWWNLIRWDGSSAGADTGIRLLPMTAEFARPYWNFGQATYAFTGAFCRDRHRRTDRRGLHPEWLLVLADRYRGRADAADGGHSVRSDRCGQSDSRRHSRSAGGQRQGARFRRATGAPGYAGAAPFGTRRSTGRHDLAGPGDRVSERRRQDRLRFLLSSRQASDHQAPEGTLPPLLVKSHGGPTASASSQLSLPIQYWTSRGFAVVDVNYVGSTGYGTAYRRALDGIWGVADVEDCVAAATHLVNQGLADPDRIAITGGSAGGYTTLCALTFTDRFRAGGSHYGISDLKALYHDTHKFESRYLDRLIGPLETSGEIIEARSPIHHLD